eukprot:766439-Hanusia_phi.AAC.6
MESADKEKFVLVGGEEDEEEERFVDAESRNEDPLSAPAFPGSDDGKQCFESSGNELFVNDICGKMEEDDAVEKPGKCVECQEFYASFNNRCSLCAKKHLESSAQEEKETEAVNSAELDDPNVIAGSAVVGAGIGLLAGGGLMAVAGGILCVDIVPNALSSLHDSVVCSDDGEPPSDRYLLLAGIGALAASRKGYWGDQSRAAGKHVVNAAKAAKDVGDKWKIPEKANAVASDAQKRIQDAKLKDKMDNAIRKTDEFLTASARRADEMMINARYS